MHNYILRLAHTADVAAIVALEEQWTAEDTTIGQIAASAEQVSSWLGPFCWVAEQTGTIIGFSTAAVQTSEGLAVIPAGERYLQIDELYVVPAYRDSGVGGRLVERVLAEAASQGISRGRVYSASRDWQRIISFYERQGFKMWGLELYR